MSKDTRNCDNCNILYDKGFYGTGYRYCSRKCRDDVRDERTKNSYKKEIADCAVCGRDIGSVGMSKNTNKYCTVRCMHMARRIRKGQKYCYIRIPVTVQKLVKIPIEDIPIILKRDEPKQSGK